MRHECPCCRQDTNAEQQLTSMFDNANPEAVNTIAANAKHHLSEERIDNLARALSGRYCEMSALIEEIADIDNPGPVKIGSVRSRARAIIARFSPVIPRLPNETNDEYIVRCYEEAKGCEL